MLRFISANGFWGPLLLTLFLQCRAVAQVIPAPGAKLNYTQIMFEHPQVAGAEQYLLEVGTDGPDAATAFAQPVISRKDSSCGVMLDSFEFGKKYLWRYAVIKKGKAQEWKGPYGFEILFSEQVDKNHVRVRVLENKLPVGQHDLVALDMAGIIINREGEPVWFVPEAASDTQGNAEAEPVINDLRISGCGTITLLSGTDAEELDLAGHVLWQAPQAKQINSTGNVLRPVEGYNHCFKKLANGNYMAIAGAIKYWPATALGITGSTEAGVNIGDTTNVMLAYEILKEFDKKGKVVWSWSSEKYFNNEELRAMVLSAPDKGLLSPIPGGHLNAFDVDEKNGFVYAGFRNVSRVIKIDKKTGNVMCAWGTGMIYKGAANGDGFFSKQHETTLLKDGSVAVFNNNSLANGNGARARQLPPANGPVGPGLLNGGLLGGSTPSGVVIFSQPSDTGNSRLTWKFDCLLDPMHDKSLRGGSVNELKNGDLLVSMGAVNRIFEITRSKQIVWNAVIEKRPAGDTTWMPQSLFKAYSVSSLYPCYFTLQASADTLKKTSGRFTVSIFNDGTEGDSYRVAIMSKGGYKKQLEIKGLQGQSSTRFEIAPDKLPVADDRLEIMVQSVTNPNFKRTVEVAYMK